MKNPYQPLSPFFAEFCESQTHFDSLLSKIKTNQKSKIADKMGVFLRRPWAIAKHYNVQLADSPEEFWDQGFLRMKKSEAIHEVLTELWKSDHGIPLEGGLDDFPSEMSLSWVQDWGADVAKKMARLLSQDPHTTIRFTRKADAAAIIAQVEAENGKPRLGYYSPRALIFKGYAAVFGTEAFEKGWFEIQDEGSQVMSAFTLADGVVAGALKERPSTERAAGYDAKVLEAELAALKAMTVVDACAGSGGKTLALADMMKGQGRVYGYDIYARKIQALKKRVDRAGETSVQAVHLENENIQSLEKFAGKVDRLLLDSPCSGWGVLRRNPDIKWNRKPRVQGSVTHQDRTITDAQHDVIKNYLPLLKPGGVMVYGVCTFQKAETTDQVNWILKQYPELTLRHSGFIGPHETDGFFMASFVKSGV